MVARSKLVHVTTLALTWTLWMRDLRLRDHVGLFQDLLHLAEVKSVYDPDLLVMMDLVAEIATTEEMISLCQLGMAGYSCVDIYWWLYK